MPEFKPLAFALPDGRVAVYIGATYSYLPREKAAEMIGQLCEATDTYPINLQPQCAVIDAKYDDVLVPFARLMAKELHANAGKGDRPGWLAMTPAVGMLEIYYHAAKLQKAVKDDNTDGIREYAADVANMAMMLIDGCGRLEVGALHHVEGARVPDMQAMVDRFLGWRLPDNFSPDCYISFNPEPLKQRPGMWPVGTNLLDAEQAKAMLEYVFATSSQPKATAHG